MIFNFPKKITSAACALIAVMGLSGTAHAGVALGATRVVYPSDQKQVTLGVTNNDDNSTYLIQSWVENTAGQKDDKFVITPPLFVIKGKRENTLRIIDATNHTLPTDRESLFWINVKAIPSMSQSQESKNTLQLAIISRIKLFYRPVGLSIPPEAAPTKLRFSKVGNKLILSNPTPYYLTVTSIHAGTKALDNTMVAPMGKSEIPFPSGSDRHVTYQTINDFGALTPVTDAIFQ